MMKPQEQRQVNQPPLLAFTDGSSRGNPGPGGFGVILKYGRHIKELSQGYRWTTNNRMELLAVIFALNQLKRPSTIQIFTDSQYVTKGITWARKWEQNQWRKSSGGNVKNVDLWTELLRLTSVHNVRFEWIPGHSSHPENEKCDLLAKLASESDILFDDFVYERTNPDASRLDI